MLFMLAAKKMLVGDAVGSGGGGGGGKAGDVVAGGV